MQRFKASIPSTASRRGRNAPRRTRRRVQAIQSAVEANLFFLSSSVRFFNRPAETDLHFVRGEGDFFSISFIIIIIVWYFSSSMFWLLFAACFAQLSVFASMFTQNSFLFSLSHANLPQTKRNIWKSSGNMIVWLAVAKCTSLFSTDAPSMCAVSFWWVIRDAIGRQCRNRSLSSLLKGDANGHEARAKQQNKTTQKPRQRPTERAIIARFEGDFREGSIPVFWNCPIASIIRMVGRRVGFSFRSSSSR